MKFRPETRARYEQTWFPISARAAARAGPVPGEDRGARQERRPRRQPDPRLRRSRSSPACASRRRSLSDRLRDEAAAAVRAPELDRRAARSRRPASCTAASRSSARPRTRDRPAARDSGLLDPPQRRRVPRRRARDAAAARGRTARSPAASACPLDGAPPGRYELIVRGHRPRRGPGRRDARAASRSTPRPAAELSGSGPAELGEGALRRRAGSGRGAATRGTPPPRPRGRRARAA